MIDEQDKEGQIHKNQKEEVLQKVWKMSLKGDTLILYGSVFIFLNFCDYFSQSDKQKIT